MSPNVFTKRIQLLATAHRYCLKLQLTVLLTSIAILANTSVLSFISLKHSKINKQVYRVDYNHGSK